MRYFLLILLALTSSAMADSEARNGSDWVRLTARPCASPKVLEQVAQARENALDFRAAVAQFNGAGYTACWRPDMHQRVIRLRYEDGDEGFVPFEQLQPVREV